MLRLVQHKFLVPMLKNGRLYNEEPTTANKGLERCINLLHWLFELQ